MTYKVGITGGIGAGKTICAHIFEILGVPIYNADQRAKQLMTQNAEVKQNIIEAFGEQSYYQNGKLNRKYLADQIFKDKRNTKKINQIVHPAVGKDLLLWFESVKEPYALYEAALMIESGSSNLVDKIIVVVAPLHIRLERVMERDKVALEDVIRRKSKQMSQEEMEKSADYIIINDGSRSLISEILRIHAELLVLAVAE